MYFCQACAHTLEVDSEACLFVSIKNPHEYMRYQKRDERASGLVLRLVFIYIFIYLCILSGCHSNGRMSICMRTGWGAEGAPGSDSIHKQELPPRPIFAIFFIRTNKRKYSTAQRITQHCVLNMTIKRGRLAVCITILAGKNNIQFYCNSHVYKLTQCQFINPIYGRIFVIIKYPWWYKKIDRKIMWYLNSLTRAAAGIWK